MAILDPGRNTGIRESTAGASFQHKQRRQMLAALTVLLVALVLVLIKDRDFWFSPADSGTAESGATLAPARPPAQKITSENISKKRQLAATPSREKAVKAPAALERPSDDSQSAIVVTNRAVLPALEVEVVGSAESGFTARDNAVQVEMQDGNPGVSSAASNGPTEGTYMNANAPQRVQLSPGTSKLVSQSVQPNYPLLAKQMRVQGAVVLEALIDTSGNIQGIRVLSGPAILSDAAREAVKQWHFKPYYQLGRAVETQARITVNFTISTY